MTISAEERRERLDGPVHGWFGLSYANYAVLHRSMMQSMPVEWQERAVALLAELDDAFEHVKRPPAYIVQAARECDYADLNARDMAELGVTCSDDDDEHQGDTVYWDRDGREHDPYDRLLVPVADEVPLYDRGRTFIEPAEDGLRLVEGSTDTVILAEGVTASGLRYRVEADLDPIEGAE